MTCAPGSIIEQKAVIVSISDSLYMYHINRMIYLNDSNAQPSVFCCIIFSRRCVPSNNALTVVVYVYYKYKPTATLESSSVNSIPGCRGYRGYPLVSGVSRVSGYIQSLRVYFCLLERPEVPVLPFPARLLESLSLLVDLEELFPVEAGCFRPLPALLCLPAAWPGWLDRLAS